MPLNWARRFIATSEPQPAFISPNADLFDAWVRHLPVNPLQGQDCPGGFWWEDICWHRHIERATAYLNEFFREDRKRHPERASRPFSSFRIWQDERGRYQVAFRHE